MFKHLLVPLDGSAMSEAVVPAAADLARRAGASVTLLHVLEEKPPSTVHGQRHLQTAGEAEQYLGGVAQGAFPPDVQVRRHVHQEPTSRVAESLAFHAEEFQPDLIVMCAHGGVRLRDRVLGSLAQQVVHRRRTSVLLLRVGADGLAHYPFDRVVAPLDGQPAHEQGLTFAAKIARLCSAPMLLMTVVPTSSSLGGAQAVTGALLPGATQQLLEMSEDQAVSYLQRHVERLLAEGLQAAGRVVRGGRVRLICQAAGETAAAVVVLGTHGKAGTHAFWSGSLGPKLLRKAEASFLLAPVPT